MKFTLPLDAEMLAEIRSSEWDQSIESSANFYSMVTVGVNDDGSRNRRRVEMRIQPCERKTLFHYKFWDVDVDPFQLTLPTLVRASAVESIYYQMGGAITINAAQSNRIHELETIEIALQAELEEANNRAASLNDRIMELYTFVNKTELERNDLRRLCESKDAEIMELGEMLGSRQLELEALRGTAIDGTDWPTRFGLLQETHTTVLIELERVRGILNQKYATIDTLQEELIRAAQRINQLESDVNSYIGGRDAALEELDELNGLLDELRHNVLTQRDMFLALMNEDQKNEMIRRLLDRSAE